MFSGEFSVLLFYIVAFRLMGGGSASASSASAGDTEMQQAVSSSSGASSGSLLTNEDELEQRGQGQSRDGAVATPPAPKKFSFFSKQALVFAVPAAFDVCGTGFGGVGLLFIQPSVWQMMRGSLLLFTAILSIVFLKKRLNIVHWTALLVTFCGLSLVGFSTIMTPAASPKAPGHHSKTTEMAMETDR